MSSMMNANLVLGTSENLFCGLFHHWPKRIRTGSDLIAHYTHAVEPNGLCWLALTYPWLKNATAQSLILDTLRIEQKDNRRAMLLAFARECGALPSGSYYAVDAQVLEVHRLFQDTENAGLVGLTVRIILEHLLPMTILDLKKASRLCGNRNQHWKYLQVLGKEDGARMEALKTALNDERLSGYDDPDRIISQSIVAIGNVLQQIFLMPAPEPTPTAVKRLEQTHTRLH